MTRRILITIKDRATRKVLDRLLRPKPSPLAACLGCGKLTGGGGLCFRCSGQARIQREESAKPAEHVSAEDVGARDGAPPTYAGRTATGGAIVLGLVVLLSGCCGLRGARAQGTRQPGPLRQAIQGQQNQPREQPRAVCTDAGEHLRMRDEIGTLGRQLRELQASRDRLNEGNTALLHQLAREREQAAAQQTRAEDLERELAHVRSRVPLNPNVSIPAPSGLSRLPGGCQCPRGRACECDTTGLQAALVTQQQKLEALVTQINRLQVQPGPAIDSDKLAAEGQAAPAAASFFEIKPRTKR